MFRVENAAYPSPRKAANATRTRGRLERQNPSRLGSITAPLKLRASRVRPLFAPLVVDEERAAPHYGVPGPQTGDHLRAPLLLQAHLDRAARVGHGFRLDPHRGLIPVKDHGFRWDRERRLAAGRHDL